MNKSKIIEKIEGDPDLWDNLWREKNISKKSFDKILFNTGIPDTLSQFRQKCYFEDLWSLIKQKNNYKKFLELGSGRGTTSMYLSYNGIDDITFVDLSTQGFKIATENFKKYNLKLPKFVEADVLNTKLPSSGFDCIYNIGLLEHFLDPKPVLQEAFRLLKSGGLIFMVIVPKIPFYRSMLVRLFLNPLPIHYFKSSLINILQYLGYLKKRRLIRTSYPRSYYITIMRSIGAVNIDCLAYNPYHTVYHNRYLEKNICLPLYNLFYNIKKKKSSPPWLKTSSFVAICDLLICYKK